MKRQIKNVLKTVMLTALSLSMIVPGTFVQNVNAEEVKLIKEYDFEKGFREFHDTDSAYKIISAGGQYIKKTKEQREGNERVDANDFVIQGEGANAKYYTQVPGNQPSTKYDSEKGTVLFLAGTYDVPELVKELPANVEGDEEGSKLLDLVLPVGSVVREAARFKSALTLTNPLNTLESENAVLAFWGKVPADSQEEKIAFVEFSNGNTSVSFCYDGSVERGKWHYYAYIIEKDTISLYIDGEESTALPVVDGTAPEDMISFLKTANFYFGATNISTVNTVEETVMDDVSFYDGTMTDEDVKALYNKNYVEYMKGTDIANPLAFLPLDSTDEFTNLNEENPSTIETFNINGHAVDGIAVVENTKGDYKNGIKIENPFKGLRLEGATVGYWIQVEPRQRIIDGEKYNDPKKGYTGNYPNEYIINETVALSFMDTKKEIYNPKHNSSDEGFSYLYTKTRMQGYFEEGGHYELNTGNYFEVESDEETASKYSDESRNWHYMTLVMNNGGIELYYDGKKVEGLYENPAPRFMDGYYRRVGERSKISTLYGAFGGSGNQTATLMTTFLAYEDTDMYFGWLPISEYKNELSSPVNVTRMSCYDTSMSASEVAELYEYEMSSILSLPEYVEKPELLGDLNQDGNVNAQDALIVLKIAAKIEEATEDSLLNGDMDANGQLNAQDALSILKIAAKID